jgi:hypothetical protein
MTRRHLIIALLGVIWLGSTRTEASVSPVPVVVKLLPGANLSLVTNLLGGKVLDSIRFCLPR